MNTPANSSARYKIWLARAVNLLIMLAFLPSAGFKLTSNPMAVQGFAEMGISTNALLVIGVVELACLVIYLLPRTAGLGTLLLTGYLGGATMANIAHHTDFLHALAIGLIVWSGAWLRVPGFGAFIGLGGAEQTGAVGRERPDNAYPAPAR